MNQQPNEHSEADDQFSEETLDAAASQVEQELAAVRNELADLQDKFLRVSADYQNYVRRSHQNLESAKDLQLMDLAKSLITVMDHFDHALEVDPEKTSTQSVMQGVQIVRSELQTVLQRFGIERLEVKPGESFDPNRHEALMRQPAEGIESGNVAAQIQPGYVLRDKTLRPAKVTVAE